MIGHIEYFADRLLNYINMTHVAGYRVKYKYPNQRHRERNKRRDTDTHP